MHIGIVELCEKNHHSMIFNWIKIANFNKWKVTLFTNQEIFNNVKFELEKMNYDVVINDTNNFFFQIKINKIIKQRKIDKLIYLTICNYFLYLFISLKSITFGITVHNANAWFNKTTLRKLKHILKRFIISKLKKEASFFIVNSQNMKKFVDKNCSQIKPIYVLPFSLRKNYDGTKIKKYEKFTTVYPGSINHERRRYDDFIKLALNNSEDNFIVLGDFKKSEKDIIIYNKIKKIPNIKLFEKYVDIQTFNKILRKSHLLFCDVKVNYEASDVTETYGKSKDTGVSYLMNEFNLPCMLNSDFKNFYELRNASLYFENSNNMFKIYDDVKKDKKLYNYLINKIKEDTQNFNINYYSKKFKKSFV